MRIKHFLLLGAFFNLLASSSGYSASNFASTNHSLFNSEWLENEEPRAVSPRELIKDASTNGLRESLPAQKALALLGTPYRYGGMDEISGIDCSAFVVTSYREAGIRLPRTAAQIASITARIPLAQIKPGDLLFFNTQGRNNSHVAIALGGTYFAHSPRTGLSAQIDDLAHPYWRKRFESARRPTDRNLTQ